MSETSRVYLDVDGVLNAVTPQTPAWGWGAPKRRKVNGWPITWAPELVEALNEVARTPGVQVYWLTTWCHDAPSRLAPAIGLEGHDWPVVGFDHWRDSSPKVWWKLPAIQEHLDGFDGAVLWIDDDLTYDPAARAWLAGQPLVLGMSPNTGTGITRAEMETVRRFALATPDPSPAALDRTGES